MGRTKTYVGTQVDRVIQDDKVPNAAKSGLVNALFQNGDLIEHVLEEMISSVGVRAERLYSFAARGNYVHGLPSGQFKIPGRTLLQSTQTVLEGVENAVIQMDYAQYGPPNSLHIGWQTLLASHGYNPSTNVLANLSAAKGRTVYLDDMVVVVPQTMLATVEQQSLQQWGVAPNAGYTPERTTGTPYTRSLIKHSLVEVSPSAVEEHIRVHVVWLDATNVLQREAFSFPVIGYDDNADYFHARYKADGVVKFWMYQMGVGTHPSLDSLYDSEDHTAGKFFPFMYYRYGKVSELDNPTSESYKDNKKLAKILSMDYDTIAEGVNANPDIADVEQAIMMFAVPANAEDALERRYLFDFFKNMFMAQTLDERFTNEPQADIASRQLSGTALQPPSIVIQDARFKMSLVTQGIFRAIKSGQVAEVGGYHTSMATFGVITDYYDTEAQVDRTMARSRPSHYYRRQINPSQYEEIQVVDLQTRFQINEHYTTTGDDSDRILIIPLDHSITEKYSLPDRETLYSRSLHFVFNSVQTIRLKWYQTGLFRAIMVIVAIIITIYSQGSDGGTALQAALAIGAYGVAFKLIVIMVLQFLIMQAVFKLFVKVVGAKVAFIVAIVAAMYGISVGLDLGGLAGMPWGENLLQMATGIANAVADQVQVDMNDLLGEISDFAKYTEEQFKLIDSAQDLLKQDHLLSPFVIFGEKPEDFYNRTVHSGNIGVVGIEAVSTFVDMKLALPKIDESLGAGFGKGDW